MINNNNSYNKVVINNGKPSKDNPQQTKDQLKGFTITRKELEHKYYSRNVYRTKNG